MVTNTLRNRALYGLFCYSQEQDMKDSIVSDIPVHVMWYCHYYKVR